MRTAPGEKGDLLWIRAVRQLNPIIFFKKNLSKSLHKQTKTSPTYHPHESLPQTLLTAPLLLSPCHGRNKRQISCRTEREANLILLREEINIKNIKKDTWVGEERRGSEQWNKDSSLGSFLVCSMSCVLCDGELWAAEYSKPGQNIPMAKSKW